VWMFDVCVCLEFVWRRAGARGTDDSVPEEFPEGLLPLESRPVNVFPGCPR